MTNYGSHQEQVTGGLPQSLVDAASGGGGLGSAGITLTYAVNSGGASFQVTSGGAGEIDLVTDTDPNGYSRPQNEMKVDLTGMTSVRLVGLLNPAGPNGAYLKFKYSTDNTTFSDLVSGGFSVAADVVGWVDSDWQPLVAGAQSVVYLHPFTANGDNFTNTATFQPLYLQFK